MLEVEQKFRVDDISNVRHRMRHLGFTSKRVESHIDTYLRHPSRDFAVSGEAFRIRQVNDELFVTYKGKRFDSQVKIRPEIELPIGGDSADWLRLYSNLGFTIAEQVRKRREIMVALEFERVLVAVDSVERLGDFVEIELLIDESDDHSAAASKVLSLANQLELNTLEPRSYLRQILELETRS